LAHNLGVCDEQRGSTQSGTCEREQLEFEIKHGLEYEAFMEKLKAGELGDEFAYPLEMEALRWGDLIAEKKHWLQQLNVLRESFE